MLKALPLIILSISPVTISVMLGIVAFGIHAIGRGFGGEKSPAPVVITAVIVWLLHAGYLIGPWLYMHQRQTLALILMIPLAIVGLVAAALITKQLVPENREAMGGKFMLYFLMWMFALLMGYIAPIVVMLMPSRYVSP